jgi:hypothetical protein
MNTNDILKILHARTLTENTYLFGSGFLGFEPKKYLPADSSSQLLMATVERRAAYL